MIQAGEEDCSQENSNVKLDRPLHDFRQVTKKSLKGIVKGGIVNGE
jgi:hypothetical protein